MAPAMNAEKLKALRIDPDEKQRRQGSFWFIVVTVLAVLAVSIFFAWPRLRDRERIKVSPRFLGVVKWIGVKKGDPVTNGQIVVQLDDAEYKARLLEAEGRVASVKAMVDRAEHDFERVGQL